MYFNRFIIEQPALKTEYGRNIYKLLIEKGLKPEVNRFKDNTVCDYRSFKEGKRTLIIGSRNLSRFESCKPSANYQLPILTGCPGMCEYCYLITRMGEKPYVKINANIDNIFTNIQKYIDQSTGETVSFELSASSDPLPFEEPTGIVSKMIEYFSGQQRGKLRICSKFVPEKTILDAEHNNHTDFRFSMNSEYVIRQFEHGTPSLDVRIESAEKIIKANYNTGIMIAPVILYDGWREDYKQLLKKLKNNLGDSARTFEIVTHRYTTKAKETINNIFPESSLDMENENRKFKMGQFGYGKYVYDNEKTKEIKGFFGNEIASLFKNSELLYVV